MGAADATKYAAVFARTDADGDGFVEGKEGAAVLAQSGLPKPQLKARMLRCWFLDDAVPVGVFNW